MTGFQFQCVDATKSENPRLPQNFSLHNIQAFLYVNGGLL